MFVLTRTGSKGVRGPGQPVFVKPCNPKSGTAKCFITLIETECNELSYQVIFLEQGIVFNRLLQLETR
jgi:hypothetical protein